MVVRYQFNRRLVKELNIHIPWTYTPLLGIYSTEMHTYALKDMDMCSKELT